MPGFGDLHSSMFFLLYISTFQDFQMLAAFLVFVTTLFVLYHEQFPPKKSSQQLLVFTPHLDLVILVLYHEHFETCLKNVCFNCDKYFIFDFFL